MVRLDRRGIYIGLGYIVVATLSLLGGMRLSQPAGSQAAVAAGASMEFQQAVETYRADHGWYPGDPDRDWNSDGSPDILRRQLTEFTRDDGKPAERRDPQYCFGPYLRQIPSEPHSGSGTIVVDQDGARALSRLRRDVAAGSGRGGWYYEARTGHVIANRSRTGASRYAAF